MTPESIKRLQKYEASVKSRLESPTPIKHAHRDCSYREYLKRELEAVTGKIVQAKLEAK